MAKSNDMKKITLFSPIFSFTAETFVEKLLEVEQDEDVEILMNSPGGSVFAGWSIVGSLNEREGKNIAKVYGDAASMAFYALLFMDEVQALDVSTFMIHRADGYAETDEDKKFLADVNKQLRSKLEKKIDAGKFKEVTGVTFDEIFDMETRINVNLSAKDAKKIGLVDKIIRLEPKQIAAMSRRFVGFADFDESESVSHGSETGEPQGSGASQTKQQQGKEKKEESNSNYSQKTGKNMTKEELKAQHPDVYKAIYDEGVNAERERVEALNEFIDIDPESVKKMISEGKNPGHKFYAEMTKKSMSAKGKAEAKEEAEDPVEPGGSDDGKTPDKVKAEKEYKDAETEARRAAGLKVEPELEKQEEK